MKRNYMKDVDNTLTQFQSYGMEGNILACLSQDSNQWRV